MNSTNASVPDPEGEYQVIRLGGHEAAFVSLADLRRLQAVDQHDTAEVVEGVEVASTIATYRAWAAAGRPGAISHKQAMAELLTGP